MLTVLVAGTAAAAAIFGQFFSTLQSKSENASLLNIESIYEQTLPQILPEADKQVDAFFVSHGMAQQQPVNEPVQLVEPVIEIPKDKPIHEISKISEIGNGENWLILRQERLFTGIFCLPSFLVTCLGARYLKQ